MKERTSGGLCLQMILLLFLDTLFYDCCLQCLELVVEFLDIFYSLYSSWICFIAMTLAHIFVI